MTSALPYRLCAGVMLVNAEGLIFAGQRRDQSSEAWQMPQGGIDSGETPRSAALRELSEETGIQAHLVNVEQETSDWIRYDLPIDLVPSLWGGRFRGQKQKWFRMRFLGNDSDIDIRTETPEFSSWRWMAPEVLLKSIVPFKHDVYRSVLAELLDGRDGRPIG